MDVKEVEKIDHSDEIIQRDKEIAQLQKSINKAKKRIEQLTRKTSTHVAFIEKQESIIKRLRTLNEALEKQCVSLITLNTALEKQFASITQKEPFIIEKTKKGVPHIRLMTIRCIDWC